MLWLRASRTAHPPITHASPADSTRTAPMDSCKGVASCSRALSLHHTLIFQCALAVAHRNRTAGTKHTHKKTSQACTERCVTPRTSPFFEPLMPEFSLKGRSRFRPLCRHHPAAMDKAQRRCEPTRQNTSAWCAIQSTLGPQPPPTAFFVNGAGPSFSACGARLPLGNCQSSNGRPRRRCSWPPNNPSLLQTSIEL